MMKINRVGDVRCRLGEGPVWDTREQALYFLDIREQKLWRYEEGSGAFRSWDLPMQPGAYTATESGGAILALADGFYDFDSVSGACRSIVKPPLNLERTQFNDGKVDRRGRFVAGTTDNLIKDPLSVLFRLEGDTAVVLDKDYIVINGPCWSPDGGIFYCADTIKKAIYAYDYDIDSGAMTNKHIFAKTDDLGGFIDGTTVDSTGNVWTTLLGVGKLVCYNPQGAVERVIETPTKWLSSAMFGGPKLDRLYVTSVNPETFKLGEEEAGGYLYVIDGLGVKGIAEPLARR